MSPRSRKLRNHYTSSSFSEMEKVRSTARTKRHLMLGGVGLVFIVGIIAYSVASKSALDKKTLLLQQKSHQRQSLPDTAMNILQNSINQQRFYDLLQPILIQRIPGTENSTKVRNHIRSKLQDLRIWNVTEYPFYASPPSQYQIKPVHFNNIVASTWPKASRKLVLACHYDSKVLPNQYFVAATDSAVPCAMLLELATALEPLIKEHSRKQFVNDPSSVDIGLELVFFDGEEAFLSWTNSDSLYGSRQLAALWHNTTDPLSGISVLDQVDLFVLLDLIGHEGASFVNFHSTSTPWFDTMREIERRLYENKRLKNHRRGIFASHGQYERTHVEDDHIPFVRLSKGRKFPVMHLISVPFPPGWHTVRDNAQLINYDRTMNILRVVTQFVAEYLQMAYPPK